ncbi:unnamed protein product [Prorocentrum cordatum]|uniref:Gustatory receptor n=1 Tax=Prorocentrum cordatum TaxID=2364126 RepID=A0ABN9URE8_9DINO|nr:unnamed protein product [Polarella glacialis]
MAVQDPLLVEEGGRWAPEVDRIYEQSFRPTPLGLNFTMGPGLRWVRAATVFTLVMWMLVMPIVYTQLTCDPETLDAHAAKHPMWVWAILLVLSAVVVLAEAKALMYCMRPFKELRRAAGLTEARLGILGIFKVSDTKYILFRLFSTFVNVFFGLYVFGLSMVQSAGDQLCRGTTQWHFAWDATMLQSWFSFISLFFWDKVGNLTHCYFACVVLLFISFPRALLHSIPAPLRADETMERETTCCFIWILRVCRDAWTPTPPVDMAVKTVYDMESKKWKEVRFRSCWRRLCDRWSQVVKTTAMRVTGVDLGGCHCLESVWLSTFFTDASVSLAAVMGLDGLKDIAQTLAICQLHKFRREVDSGNIDEKETKRKFVQMQRRLILVLEAALRQTYGHTVMRGGVILNLQVTQFYLHRAVMLHTMNTIYMDHPTLYSILFTVGSVVVFDLMIQLRQALHMYCQVMGTIRSKVSGGTTLESIGSSCKQDKKTINLLMMYVICWAVIGYSLFAYAVLKLYMSLMACPGEGYNLGSCAPIPWDCLNTTLHPDKVGCIRNSV